MSQNKNKRFLEDYDYRVYRIKHYGKKYRWNLLSETNELVFANERCMLTIDPIRFTVQTELRHPKRGETILMRAGSFTINIIEKIFLNPRAHMPENITSKYI